MNNDSAFQHQDGLIWLELTNGCNLNCSHCYSDSGPGTQSRDRLSHKDYLRIIDESSSAGFSRIQFIGGEPLLNKALPAYIKRAADANFKQIELFSNLTFLPDSSRDAIVEYGVSVSTSVYSADSEVHDSIVHKPGSLACTIENAAALAKRSVSVRAAYVEMDENAGHYPHVQELLMAVGVEWTTYDVARGFGRAGVRSPSKDQLCGACAGNTVCVMSDGLVSPCIMSRAWPIGSILDSPLAELLSSSKTHELRNSIRDEIAARGSLSANCGPQGVCGPTGYKDPCGPQGMCGPSGKHCGPDFCSPNKAIHFHRAIQD